MILANAPQVGGTRCGVKKHLLLLLPALCIMFAVQHSQLDPARLSLFDVACQGQDELLCSRLCDWCRVR